MDKEQSKELLNAFKLIIVGIFFWILKPKMITLFFFTDSHFLNTFPFEIIGTIGILIGILLIFRTYPFAYSLVSAVYIFFILGLNLFTIIAANDPRFENFLKYTPFFMSIMLCFISKLMQNGLRHFGSKELSQKWSKFAVIIMFGFTIPYYSWTTVNIMNFVTYSKISFNGKIFIAMLPVFLIIFYSMIYYLYFLILSFNHLSSVQKKFNKKKAKNEKLNASKIV